MFKLQILIVSKQITLRVLAYERISGARAIYALQDGGQDGGDEKLIGDSDISVTKGLF
jgi:hypothetical protein